MGQRDIIALLAKLFEKYKISYVLTGSFAVSYWGHPRATHDIDFLVELESPDKHKLLDLLSELDQGFSVDLYQAENAIDKHWQFNVFHQETSIKIDFWIAQKSEFEKNKFKRKITTEVFGEKVAIVSAEDLILTKLSWCKDVFSERHMRDCIGILEVQKGKLDEKYLRENAEALGVVDLLKQAREGKYYC